VGTFNFSAKYLSKKDSSTMGIVRKVLLGLENRAGCIFSLFSMLLNDAYVSKFETGWEP
jgi:hypothetical protein